MKERKEGASGEYTEEKMKKLSGSSTANDNTSKNGAEEEPSNTEATTTKKGEIGESTEEDNIPSPLNPLNADITKDDQLVKKEDSLTTGNHPSGAENIPSDDQNATAENEEIAASTEEGIDEDPRMERQELQWELRDKEHQVETLKAELEKAKASIANLEDQLIKQTGLISSLKSGILHMDPIKGKFFLRDKIGAMEDLLLLDSQNKDVEKTPTKASMSSNGIPSKKDKGKNKKKKAADSKKKGKKKVEPKEDVGIDGNDDESAFTDDEPPLRILEEVANENEESKQAQVKLAEAISQKLGAFLKPPAPKPPSSSPTSPPKVSMAEKVVESLKAPISPTFRDHQARSELLPAPVERELNRDAPIKTFTPKHLPQGTISQEMMLEQIVSKKKKASRWHW